MPEKENFSFLTEFKDLPDDDINNTIETFRKANSELWSAIGELNTSLAKIESERKENGPDHEGPSRHPQNPSTAVDAALTPPKEEDQT